jgi:hypothetical protein
VTRSIIAAAAAGLFAMTAASAQEAEAPTTYVLSDDGSATHNATGAHCPAEIPAENSALILVQVMSFDSETDHLGIGCQYANISGFTAGISILRSDQPELVGAGTAAARWNRSLYQILGNYPAALPANVAGLEGDPSVGMRGALFTANESGVPIRLGVWQIDETEWQFRAQTTFVATSAASQWALAEQTRAALLAAKSSAN